MTLLYGFQAPASSSRLVELAQRLKEHHFSCIEVSAPDEIDPDYQAAIQSVRDGLGYRITVHARYLDVDASITIPLIRKAAVKILREDLGFATEISAARFTMHAGSTHWYDVLPVNHPHFKEMDAVQQRLHKKHLAGLAESLGELYEALPDNGLRISLENGYCPWELFADPGEMGEFFEKHYSPLLAATLDFGHAGVAGHAPQEFIDRIGLHINHIHLAQNKGKYDLHLPIQKMPSKWRQPLTELDQSTVEVPVIFEWRSEEIYPYIQSMQVMRL